MIKSGIDAEQLDANRKEKKDEITNLKLTYGKWPKQTKTIQRLDKGIITCVSMTTSPTVD